jgi:hypothetical protein
MLLTELFLLSQHWVFFFNQMMISSFPKALKMVAEHLRKQECSEEVSFPLGCCAVITVTHTMGMMITPQPHGKSP